MKYRRMPIEKESPEELGYDTIKYNLAESSVSDVLLRDLQLDVQHLSLCYTHHRGHPQLRELVAADGNGINAEDVLITAGAAAALFMIATCLLTSNDHMLVVRPNYATNIETPLAIGCSITYVDLVFEQSWKPDLELIEKSIQPNTRYISITHPHNPTGMVMEEEELRRLIVIAEKYNVYLLADETYRDLTFGPLNPYLASVSEKVISVSSVSKAYGLPGLRIGWVITKDKALMEQLLAAKEQIFISNSVLDEEVALQFLQQKEMLFNVVKDSIREKFSILCDWITNEPGLEWIKPGGGVICFPRIKSAQPVTGKFYQQLLHTHSTMVGPGHWFNMPDHYMRIGYAWPKKEDLISGLKAISLALKEVC